MAAVRVLGVLEERSGRVLVASTWLSVQSSWGNTTMSAWLGLQARKSWKLRVPSAPSAVSVRVVSRPTMAPDWISDSSLWVTSACCGRAGGGAGAGDDGVDLRVAVLVEQRVAGGGEAQRGALRRSPARASWPSAAPPCVPSATWLWVSTLP